MAEKDKLAQVDEEMVVASVSPAGKHRVWPLMLGLLLGVPLTCYLMIDFLVLPKLVAAVGAPAAGAPAAVPAAAGTSSAAPDAAPAQHAATGKELTVDFGKIMVNLAGTEGNRYLRINLVFASNNPGIKEIIKTNEVALRDGVITVLSAQSLANLEGNEGRETARRSLISRVNGILGGPVVTQIYFTDFVIQ
ncbi:MAG: flagellar basal body-associated FliL family protein [Verrucomicrobiota bacterium]|jgi:flagellar FliL protein